VEGKAKWISCAGMKMCGIWMENACAVCVYKNRYMTQTPAASVADDGIGLQKRHKRHRLTETVRV